MYGKYYKVEGKLLDYALDWLIARKTVLEQWKKFAHFFGFEYEDLEIEGCHLVGLRDGPPFNQSDIEAAGFKKLLTLPDDVGLGKLLGVDKAQALCIAGKGILILVFGESKLQGGRELSNEELSATYGIHVRAKECGKCGLTLSYDENRCHRCGEEVYIG